MCRLPRLPQFVIVAVILVVQLSLLFVYQSYRGVETACASIELESVSSTTLSPEERVAKAGIALDELNEAQPWVNVSTGSAVVDDGIVQEVPEAALRFPFDYSRSHPFENECRFPVIRHDDPDLSYFISHYRDIDCTWMRNVTSPLVHQLRTGEILVGRPHRSRVKNFQCYFKPLSGALAPNKHLVTMEGNWKPLPTGKRIFIQKDQFVVQCWSGNETVFHNAYAWVSDKPRLSPPAPPPPQRQFGISILIVDSTARNQFFRHMPLTLEFMREHEWDILRGYTKVGDNSALNLLALLSGMVYNPEGRGFQGLLAPDNVINTTDVSELDTLIKQARAAGCPTMWNDEIANPSFGLYHYYDFSGFAHPIADYYFRPFYQYSYTKLKAITGCSNGQPVLPRWLNLWEQFATKFGDRCHFGFNFITAFTHASSNNLELFDSPVVDALQRMRMAKVMDNTIMVIMGDHGQRISPIQEKYMGRIEERMSLMAVHIPDDFKKEYPEQYAHFIENKNRLTSNFDMYETFQDILDLNTQKPFPRKTKRGISLFSEIPRNRTCPEALIPENFCMCMEEVEDDRLQSLDLTKEPYKLIRRHFEEVFTNSCIVEHSFEFTNESAKVFSISEMSRKGVRYPVQWKEYQKKRVTRDIFEVELYGNLTLFTNDNVTLALTTARVQFNLNSNEFALIAAPMLKSPDCPGSQVAEQFCDQCFS